MIDAEISILFQAIQSFGLSSRTICQSIDTMSTTRSPLSCSDILWDKRKEKLTKISVYMTKSRSSWNFHTLNTASDTLYTSFQSMLSKLNDRYHYSIFDWVLLVINHKTEFRTFQIIKHFKLSQPRPAWLISFPQMASRLAMWNFPPNRSKRSGQWYNKRINHLSPILEGQRGRYWISDISNY